MSVRSPLGTVRGLGSAKEGVNHFWEQRLTGLALVPLGIWFVISVIHLVGGDYGKFHAWLSNPCNTTLMVLLLVCSFHHAQLGVQVVIEDYVHGEATKLLALIATKFAAALFGLFSVVAVLRTAFVGG